MPSASVNYGLALYNSSTDQAETFLDYRTDIAGVSLGSNMNIIDTALGVHDVDILALQARKSIVAVSATYDSPNTYIATVSAISAYTTDDIIALKIDTDSNGTITLNINALGAKSLMKVDSSGSYINLSGSDLRAEREYSFKYDGTRYVWMDATAADQINVNGTSGNFTMINSDNELEDSTVAPASFTLNAATSVSANAWVLDEDTLVSDDATKVATQQSVKAYADTNIGNVARNLLMNAQFKGASYGTTAIAISDGAGLYFADRWRGKYTLVASSATMQQIDAYSGGTELILSTAGSADYFYFRQTIPGVLQFSEKTYTVRFETGTVAADMQYDIYINARWNASDRENQVALSPASLASDTIYTYTFTVEDLSGFAHTPDQSEGLEFAVRVISPSGKTTQSVEMKSMALYEGAFDNGVPFSDPTYEKSMWEQYHSTSDYHVPSAGLDATSGQKRVFFSFPSESRLGSGYTLTLWDSVGTVNKISLEDLAGSVTDNVGFGATVVLTKLKNGFIVTLTSSTQSGIGCEWEMSAEN